MESNYGSMILAPAVTSFPVKISRRGTVPVWMPDGKRLVILSDAALYLADAEKTANAPVRLTDPSRDQLAQSWTSSGDQLVYEDWSDDAGIDLMVLDTKDKRVVRLDLNTSSNEFGAGLPTTGGLHMSRIRQAVLKLGRGFPVRSTATPRVGGGWKSPQLEGRRH